MWINNERFYLRDCGDIMGFRGKAALIWDTLSDDEKDFLEFYVYGKEFRNLWEIEYFIEQNAYDLLDYYGVSRYLS